MPDEDEDNPLHQKEETSWLGDVTKASWIRTQEDKRFQRWAIVFVLVDVVFILLWMHRTMWAGASLIFLSGNIIAFSVLHSLTRPKRRRHAKKRG
jgi:hypothetical protein